ncbi:MAG: hypothetical protein UR78_C0013G0024 [Candidatus Moranbacteria bacterium GW2011_GWF2_35_39]|nr:MAG: hypothetical protein UR78_C0013G0024 [Candidatus Moranbacteria bacterium GW2011_GWF2_35_39]
MKNTIYSFKAIGSNEMVNLALKVEKDIKK